MFPRIEHPLFTVEVPSTKKKIKMRPMLVKEEKILLMAKESQENNAIMLAVKQVVNNCVADANFDVNKVTLFDIDFLFIKLRANSIDSKVKISFRDDEDDPVVIKGIEELPLYEREIDLNDITIKFPEKISNVISTGKESGIKLRFPLAETYESKKIAAAETPDIIIEELIMNSFDSYFEGDKIYSFSEANEKEKIEFIDNLSITVYGKVVEFFENIPSIYYELKYTNKKGKEKTITLNKLTDFFTF